jgi:hypothetical protein
MRKWRKKVNSKFAAATLKKIRRSFRCIEIESSQKKFPLFVDFFPPKELKRNSKELKFDEHSCFVEDASEPCRQF